MTNRTDKEITFLRIQDKKNPIELTSSPPPPEFDVVAKGYENIGSMINIQTSSTCQLACKGCRGSFDTDFLRDVSKNSFIPNGVFELIVDKCVQSGIKCIELTPAIGDPFLDPDIMNKINYLHDKPEIEVIIVTTNLLKYDDDMFRELLTYDKLSLNISVYGVDRESYLCETGRDMFDIFVKNFKQLYSSIRAVGVSGYIQLTNRTKWLLREEPMMPKTDIYYMIHLYNRQDRINIDCSEVFNINRAGAVERADLAFPRSDTPERNGLCPHGPGLGGGILPNGDVLFCPFNDIYRTGVVGNIFKSTLTEIYNDKPFKQIVENHEKGVYNGICAQCNESW